MTLGMWGGVLGAAVGIGLVLVLQRMLAARGSSLRERVHPYVRDLAGGFASVPSHAPPTSALSAVFGPVLESLARGLESAFGGSTSVRRRLERAGLTMSVHDFRVEQAMWGLVALSATAVVSLLSAFHLTTRALPLLALCLVSFVVGALLRENRLTRQVKERERRMLQEFPAVAELLALSIAAGEGPVAALDRVVGRSRGELATELGRVLAEIWAGTPVARALDELAARSALPVLARFAEAVVVALERGTPLSEVMHAQAADVREAGRRALIETGARREVLMMVPVVFLVLPVTVVFAFWPGVVGLRLISP